MSSKMLAAAAITLGLAAILYAQSAQKQTQPSDVAHRYQLVPAETEEQADTNHPNQVVSAHSVFLIDTETGKVWRYQSPRLDQIQGKPLAIDATFFPVQMPN